MGVISAIGNNLAANRMALSEGRCGIGPLELFPSKYAGSLPCGEIKLTTRQLQRQLDAENPGITRTCLLALHAFEEAVRESGLENAQLMSPRTALIGGSTVGGMCHTDELYQDAQETAQGSEYINSYDCSTTMVYLQQRYNIAGIINTINTACSSSANAIMYGARLIKNGLADRAIVGGTDSLAKFTINGFNALHILSPSICTPFDKDRNGLNLGEGAAFLVLEKEEDCKSKKRFARLSGYYNSTDAFHPSSLSETGDGPYLAMSGALESAELPHSGISFINAHGTATENNDLVESRAMLKLFDEPPPFTSTKSNVGHTLGAAGAIEAVYSVLSLYHQEIYPGLHCSDPIPETGLMPVSTYAKIPIQHVMSNSFGFGGNCTSLIFSKS